MTHRLAISLQTCYHCDDGHVVRHGGPYGGIVLMTCIRVPACTTQTIDDEVDPKLGVEFSEGFGDSGSGTFEGAETGGVDESE